MNKEDLEKNIKKLTLDLKYCKDTLTYHELWNKRLGFICNLNEIKMSEYTCKQK